MFFPKTVVFHNIIKFLLIVDPLPTSIITIFKFFVCLRISTDRDLSICVIKDYKISIAIRNFLYFATTLVLHNIVYSIST